MLPQKFVSELTAAGDSPYFDQRNPSPSFPKPAVIIFHALERTSQGACRAFRAQAQIDSKQRTGRMRSRKRVENSFSEPAKELVIGTVRRKLAFSPIEKKTINI